MNKTVASRDNIERDLKALVLIPGLCGYEGRIRKHIRERLEREKVSTRTDRLGNLIATIKGNENAPSVMLFTHMDQLGFVVRKIEDGGFVRIERVGGVPERALASQPVLFQIAEGHDRSGVIANKSHHATAADEKYTVVPYRELYIDVGLDSAEAVQASGINVGTPVVYKPHAIDLSPDRIAGTAVDDRAGCAVLLEVVRQLSKVKCLPTIHVVFSVQEEFNLRGAVTAAQALQPDIAIQIDLLLTGDTPDMVGVTDVRLGAGPGISLFSFHGRGTLNGTIPHPALPLLFEHSAVVAELPLQRSAQTGALTETSYVQLAGEGIACIDVGFPCRYTHSSLEVCDLNDLTGLARLLVTALPMIDDSFSLDREQYPQ
ncbi:MAG: M42 family metallopeptidase [Rhizobiaceae bacterium]